MNPMSTLPQLLEEDIRTLEEILDNLLKDTEASAALLVDKGGFHIVSRGQLTGLDTTTLGAMASASFAATQHIATLVREEDFTSVYQQGEFQSILIQNVDAYSLLVVVFSVDVGIGVVKYYAGRFVNGIAEVFAVAYQRCPEEGFDLSVMNLADTSDVFRRKA